PRQQRRPDSGARACAETICRCPQPSQTSASVTPARPRRTSRRCRRREQLSRAALEHFWSTRGIPRVLQTPLDPHCRMSSDRERDAADDRNDLEVRLDDHFDGATDSPCVCSTVLPRRQAGVDGPGYYVLRRRLRLDPGDQGGAGQLIHHSDSHALVRHVCGVDRVVDSESDLGEAADQTAEKRKDQPKLHEGLTRVTAKWTKETIDGDQHESHFIEEQIRVKYEPDACPPRSTGRSRARIPVLLRPAAASGSSDRPSS